MNIRIAGTANDSIQSGPGNRFTVFAQGCPHQCEGCERPNMHSFEGGMLCDIEQIWAAIDANEELDGITLSGGEPFCQPGPFALLAQRAKEKGLNVWTYTGYTYEELLSGGLGGGIMELLSHTDVLIDGRFVLAQRTRELAYRGSKNQRLLDVEKSLKTHRAVTLP